MPRACRHGSLLLQMTFANTYHGQSLIARGSFDPWRAQVPVQLGGQHEKRQRLEWSSATSVASRLFFYLQKDGINDKLQISNM